MKRDRLIEQPNKAPGVLRVAKRRPIVEPGSGDDGERREREGGERRTSSVGQEPEDERRCGEGSQSEKMAEGVETGQPNQVVLNEDGRLLLLVLLLANGETEPPSGCRMSIGEVLSRWGVETAWWRICLVAAQLDSSDAQS